MIQMCWRDLQLLEHVLPADCVAKGERKRLIMPRQCQHIWLNYLFPEQISQSKDCWQLWMETDTASSQAGSDMFLLHVTSMLHHRGVVANLSLRENLLLPFLYQGNEDALLQAERTLPEVAEIIDVESYLDQQAGECSTYIHGIISLGRCMLQKPDIVVAQDVHCGMPPHQLQLFRDIFSQMMISLQAGLLYLATSEDDGSEITFEHSLALIA